ncbi:MAG: hypothetical protein A2017_05590 [Lentisphaerae bacterium GWF2_44_16]|nr:MAG: hypothetical protein A2017_05590 [Lentisphaerae bacterium GWF2_44_16]
MKKVIVMLGLVIAMVIMLSGCATPTVITEYDVQGNITKKTETSESIVEQIIASTKGKTVVAFREWYGIVMRAEPSTETLFALDLGYIHKNTGVVSVLKDQQNLDKVADIVKAIKQTDSVSASSTGVSSSSGTSTSTAVTSN